MPDPYDPKRAPYVRPPRDTSARINRAPNPRSASQRLNLLEMLINQAMRQSPNQDITSNEIGALGPDARKQAEQAVTSAPNMPPFGFAPDTETPLEDVFWVEPRTYLSTDETPGRVEKARELERLMMERLFSGK